MQISFEILHTQIAQVLNIDPKERLPTTSLAGNDKWDSFSILATVALITRYTGKQIGFQDIEKLATVDDLICLFKGLKDS